MKTNDVVIERRAPDPGKDARSAAEARERVVSEGLLLLRSNRLTFAQAAERALSHQPGAYWAEQARAYGSPLTIPQLTALLRERQSSGKTPGPPIFEPEAQPAQTAKSDLAQTLAAMEMLDEAFEEAAREVGFGKAFALHGELSDQIRRGKIGGLEAVVRLKRAA